MENVNSVFNIGGAVETPVAGGFSPSLWIGPMTATYIYKVGWMATDLAQLVKDTNAGLGGGPLEVKDPGSDSGLTFGEMLGSNVFDGVRKGQKSGKHAYFYTDPVRADAACRMFDECEPAQRKDGSTFKHRPEVIWRLTTPVADCLTLTEESKDKFGDFMSWDVTVKAFGSGSPSQHLYHLLALPAAVKAYCDLAGIKAPNLTTIEQLSGPSDEVIITETLRDNFIGGTKEAPMADSLAYQERAALWAALGEEEPTAQGWTDECWKRVTGSDDGKPDDGKAKLTDSDQLGNALRIMRSNWTGPTWAAVLEIPDPNPQNAYESNGQVKNPKVPVIKAFYADRAAAEAAVVEMGVEVATDAVSKAADTGNVQVPDVYQGDAKLWLDQVKAHVDTHLVGILTMPAPLRGAKVKAWVEGPGVGILADSLMCSADEFVSGVTALVG